MLHPLFKLWYSFSARLYVVALFPSMRAVIFDWISLIRDKPFLPYTPVVFWNKLFTWAKKVHRSMHFNLPWCQLIVDNAYILFHQQTSSIILPVRHTIFSRGRFTWFESVVQHVRGSNLIQFSFHQSRQVSPNDQKSEQAYSIPTSHSPFCRVALHM